MKKIGIVLFSIIALVLELLPFGAVIIFAPTPTETIRETYSYFSLKPFGYANFAPLLTGIFTCVLLILGIILLFKGNKNILNVIFIVSIISVVVSIIPILWGVEHYSIVGGMITVILVLESILSKITLQV